MTITILYIVVKVIPFRLSFIPSLQHSLVRLEVVRLQMWIRFRSFICMSVLRPGQTPLTGTLGVRSIPTALGAGTHSRSHRWQRVLGQQ